nr:immunoglobulin heavy chain junction region [Macaca mulatta]
CARGGSNTIMISVVDINQDWHFDLW